MKKRTEAFLLLLNIKFLIIFFFKTQNKLNNISDFLGENIFIMF